MQHQSEFSLKYGQMEGRWIMKGDTFDLKTSKILNMSLNMTLRQDRSLRDPHVINDRSMSIFHVVRTEL